MNRRTRQVYARVRLPPFFVDEQDRCAHPHVPELECGRSTEDANERRGFSAREGLGMALPEMPEGKSSGRPGSHPGRRSDSGGVSFLRRRRATHRRTGRVAPRPSPIPAKPAADIVSILTGASSIRDGISPSNRDLPGWSLRPIFDPPIR